MNELVDKFLKKVVAEVERSFDVEQKVHGVLAVMTRSQGLLEIPYKREGDSTPVNLQQKAIIVICRAMREVGEFEGVLMIHEAWCSRIPEGRKALKDVLRPALDPDRKEIVACLFYDRDGNKCSVTYDIVRGKGQAKLENKYVQYGNELKSWLDDAFVSR